MRAARSTSAQTAVHRHRLRAVFAQMNRTQTRVAAQRIVFAGMRERARVDGGFVPRDDIIEQAHRTAVWNQGSPATRRFRAHELDRWAPRARHQDRKTEMKAHAERNGESDRAQHRQRRPRLHAENEQRRRDANQCRMQRAARFGRVGDRAARRTTRSAGRVPPRASARRDGTATAKCPTARSTTRTSSVASVIGASTCQARRALRSATITVSASSTSAMPSARRMRSR